ncbi:hypothetical protein ACFL27_01070 [candidate division CSSED10-310 bacterium]|uniref:DUF2914 domain-containing protein n=1 Tax=candidate division CSSED10-310 bacterium TaxID=2855610 RepID=A0ABV6YRE2_UNCC1
MNDESKKFKKKEFRRLLELAFSLSQAEKSPGDAYTEQVIKSTAQELGISEDKMEEAMKLFEQEKLAKKKKMRLLGVAGIILLSISLIVTYTLWPRHFSGELKMTMTSAVDDNFIAVDELAAFDLFHHKKVFCLVKFFDLKYEHLITWKFFNEQGEFIEKVNLQLTTTTSPYSAWGSCKLGITSKPGRWRVKIFADEKLIGEKDFTVQYGRYDITLTSKMGEDKTPVDNLQKFLLSKHDRVVCYITWPLFQGKYRGEWKWINPQGTIDEVDTFDIDWEEVKSYWVYDSMFLKNKTAGNWKVEFFLNTVKIGEKEFQIES